LIEAGERVLRESATGAVRVEDVTERAGAAKGTFYLYFDSWDAFLLALRERVVQAYREEATARLAGADLEGDWWGWAAREIEAAIDFHLDLGGLHTALFHGPISNQPIPFDDSAPELILAMLELGASVGAVDCDDPDTAAPMIFDLLHAASDQISAGGDRERIVRCVVVLLRRWLGS
jgi:AcrR family transcriptional regulator